MKCDSYKSIPCVFGQSCPKKNRCHFSHQERPQGRPKKRLRCDDDEAYAKWLRKVENKENCGYAVICTCSSFNVELNKCNCRSIFD